MRRRAALGAAVLVLAAMAPAADAAMALGGACAKDSDCDTGHCNVYFTVRGSRGGPGGLALLFARARQYAGIGDAAHSAICGAPPRADCARGARAWMLKLGVYAGMCPATTDLGVNGSPPCRTRRTPSTASKRSWGSARTASPTHPRLLSGRESALNARRSATAPSIITAVMVQTHARTAVAERDKDWTATRGYA